MTRCIRTVLLPITLVAAFAATGAQAQEKKDDKPRKQEEKVEKVWRKADAAQEKADRARREAREWELRRRSDDRYDAGRRQGVPRGWCIGRGNPHNTVENCGRRGERYDRRYGSYQEAHQAYHRGEYERCRARLAERPLDVAWQLRVRAECNRQHDEWHRRAGRRHE